MERGWFWLYPCSPSLRKYTLDKWYYFQLLITLIFHETKGKKVPELSRFLVKFLGNNIPSRVNSCKNILRNPLPVSGFWRRLSPFGWVKCLQIENSAQRLFWAEWRVAEIKGAAVSSQGLHYTVQCSTGRVLTACQSLSPISVSRHSLTSSTSDISIITIRPITSCHYWTTDDTPQTS